MLVKLDDSVTTYGSEISGYPATSPTVTGQELTGDTGGTPVRSYLKTQERDFALQLREAIPEAEINHTLRTVYGGVALTLPASRRPAGLDGVVAVQADELRAPLTDSSIEFIGADHLYPVLGGNSNAGKGTTIGVLDTGIWPEHPSFADLGNLDPWPGPEIPCDYGDNPLTPEYDPFECQNKLVGGRVFLDTYHDQVGDEQFPGTARDDNGHGTHTAGTAAGNVLASAPVMGADHGPVQGVAPGAWVIMYRVCGPEGCFSSDMAQAVAQAVEDGVDVINFSISGGNSPFTDPVELAFLDAYAAGVFVAASAGNDGPGRPRSRPRGDHRRRLRRTARSQHPDHRRQRRHGQFVGTSVTGPAAAGGDGRGGAVRILCLNPAPAGIFEGDRRLRTGQNAPAKGYNVLQGSAAA